MIRSNSISMLMNEAMDSSKLFDFRRVAGKLADGLGISLRDPVYKFSPRVACNRGIRQWNRENRLVISTSRHNSDSSMRAARILEQDRQRRIVRGGIVEESAFFCREKIRGNGDSLLHSAPLVSTPPPISSSPVAKLISSNGSLPTAITTYARSFSLTRWKFDNFWEISTRVEVVRASSSSLRFFARLVFGEEEICLVRNRCSRWNFV